MLSESEKQFLVYVDILGFESLPREIAQIHHADEDRIREQNFSGPFWERIREISHYTKILKEGTDDCLFVVSSADDLVTCIHDLTTIPTPFLNQPDIPVEIAIDFVSISSKVKNPVNSGSVISALKNEIISAFKNEYKINNNGNKIKQTYILGTPSAHPQITGKPEKEDEQSESKPYHRIKIDFFQREYKKNTFFKTIKVERSDFSGSVIDRVFIEPNEFKQIQSSLKENHIVLISGPPGFGKTYLAIRLLWLGFNEALTPKWVQFNTHPKDSSRSFFESFEQKIKDKEIVYIEDPFGSISFSRNETLIKRLSAIIDYIKRNDIYLILTSRRDVLEEFEKLCYRPGQIQILEHELSFIAPSYDYEKRKEICERWAEEKDCHWFHQEDLKAIVFDSIKDIDLLPTPLSIHEFANATVSINNRIILEEKIHQYSHESWESFGREILDLCRSGRDDRILLLSIIYISDPVFLPFLEKEYNALKKPGYEEFDRLFAEEKKHRLSVRCRFGENETDGANLDDYRVGFAHPTYTKSLDYLIRQNCFRTIFFSVMEYLYKNRHDYLPIPEIIHDHYSSIPPSLRERILYNHLIEDIEDLSSHGLIIIEIDPTLFDNRQRPIHYSTYHSVSPAISETVIEHFSELPLVIQQLLFAVSENPNNSLHISSSLLLNYQSIPQELREVLFQLARYEDNSRGVAEALLYHFSEISEELRLALVRIVVSQIKNDSRIWILTDYFDQLPHDITDQLFRFAACDDCAEFISQGICGRYQSLPRKIQDILIPLAQNEGTAFYVASALAEDFIEIPESDRNALLGILSDKVEATFGLAWIFTEHYHVIPSGLRKKIFQFLLHQEDVSALMESIAHRFQTLPKYVQKILLRYAGNRTKSIDVAHAIVSEMEFGSIPDEMRKQILLRLSLQPAAKDTVIWCLCDFWEEFDEPFLKEMIDNLLNKNPSFGDFSLFLNFRGDIGPDIRTAMLEETIEYDPTNLILLKYISENVDDIPPSIRRRHLERTREEMGEF